MRVLWLITLAGVVPTPFLADVKVYQNDSLPLSGSGVVACQAGFVADEIGAAVYTVPPGDGKVLVIETQFFACDGSGFGLAQPRPTEVVVYSSGGPDPGIPDYTSPTVLANPGGLNIWPTIDENLTYDGGSTFTVGVRLLAGGLLAAFTTLATDADGCQPGKSLIFAIPGGWNDACSLGVSGDMFIRARVLTNGPINYGAGTAGTDGRVPSIDSLGPWWLGSNTFDVTCSEVFGGAPGFLGLSTGSAAIPLFGGTVLVNPVAVGATFVPVVATAGGAVSVSTPIPPVPSLIDAHVYFQYGFLDLGAAGNVSMSDGLDVQISDS